MNWALHIKKYLKRSWIALLLLASTYLTAQQERPPFTQITLKDGLSQTLITCIAKDSRGFMWFGTEDGLNKYDGKNITVYGHIPGDVSSLSSSYILAIEEEKEGYLWVGTKNGLNYFRPDTDDFLRFEGKDKEAIKIGDDRINFLKQEEDYLMVGTSQGVYGIKAGQLILSYEPEDFNALALTRDADGFLWLMGDQSLEKVRLNNGSIEPLYHQEFDHFFERHALLADKEFLWMGTREGLMKFNRRDHSFKVFPFFDQELNPLVTNRIMSLLPADKAKLWVGTNGKGLVLFDKETARIEQAPHDSDRKEQRKETSISVIYNDESGIQWLGTHVGGVHKYDPKRLKFDHYRHDESDAQSLSHNSVRALLRDKDGDLWVGTHAGLNRFDAHGKGLKVYKRTTDNPNSISESVVRALAEDSGGTIWAGTWTQGFNSFDKKTGNFKRYLHFPGRSEAIGAVRVIAIDPNDQLWVGGLGVSRYNPKTRSSHTILPQKNENRTRPYSVFSLYFGSSGKLWIGTEADGLIALDTLSGETRQFTHQPQDALSLSHKHVTSMVEDSSGHLWVGTYGGGLNELNPVSGTFTRYDTSNGLLNNVIYGVLIDAEGMIWFTSNAGLCRMDPQLKEFKYFGVDSGIQSEEFNAGAFHKSREGEFFFGGINGFNAFYPRAIASNRSSKPLVFTNFQLLNENGAQQASKVLESHISMTKQLSLRHFENTVSLEFAELNYSDNVDNSYEYQLIGDASKWNSLGTEREVVLANLSPGNYTLNVRIRNNPEQLVSLGLTVLPPIWRTSWAYMLYGLLLLLIGFLFLRNLRKYREARRQFEEKIIHWENSIKTTEGMLAGQPQEMLLSLKEVEITSAEEKFLQRAINIVEEHMDDSSFDVDKFMGEMFMSRSQLHRKLKRVSGYSTTGFMRLVRLKRAAQLLKGNAGSVAEIAHKVGFENVGYFSKCFRETFGVAPSQYAS